MPIPFDKLLILDVETVPQHPTYQSLPVEWQKLWDKKGQQLKKEEDQTPEDIYNRAGIYAEFGKVICISAGYFNPAGSNTAFRVTSFYGDNEKKVLSDFANLLTTYRERYPYLCGHNAKEFDFPYLCRRMLVNGIALPEQLDIAGKKPWEINHIDTMELWKFGDYKNFTSLELLARVFDVPTPKDDIDGSQVSKVYWQDKDLERIKNYCQKDVVTVAQILMKMTGQHLIAEENIHFKP